MNTKLKQEIEKVAVANGIHSMEWLGGSFYVRFQGTLPTMSADKTHIALRKIMKKHDADSGVNLFSVGDEYVYDFVPASAEAPYVDYSGDHVPQEVDTLINLEAEMARGK